MSGLGDPLVGLARDPAAASYPAGDDAFGPDEGFPEYPFPRETVSRRPNPVYRLVRRALFELGADRERFGTPAWNPLGRWIRKGESVLLKPNLVLERNLLGPKADASAVVTHGSVVRAVLDYAFIALGREGSLRVGDAPLQQCRFDAVVRLSGLDRVAEFYARHARVDIGPEDFRLLVTERDPSLQVVRRAERRDAERADRFVEVDLGAESALEEVSDRSDFFRVTCYDPRAMPRHHGPGRHVYLVSRSVLEAGVVISVPKLKTHRKAGVTGCLKNLVGINGHKDRLPHHRMGSAEEGCDAYEKASRLKRWGESVLDRFNRTGSTRAQAALALASKALVRAGIRASGDSSFEGSWHGNDTIWRTVLDLNRILLYAGADGRLRGGPCRRFLGVTDAVVAGDGEGPLDPTPKPVGVVAAGSNPAAMDFVHAAIMGFDPARIPLVDRAFEPGSSRPLAPFVREAVEVAFEGEILSPREAAARLGLSFKPPSGWSGHVEAAAVSSAASP